MTSLRLHPLFQDHAVFQSGQAVPVWGWAAPGTAIEVNFAGHQRTSKADDQHQWRVKLPVMKVCTEGKTLSVSCEGQQLDIHDIVIGSVWLCAGQSNMAFPLKNSENGESDAKLALYPSIRYLNIIRERSENPMSSFEAEPAGWQQVSPHSAEAMSAVGFYFGSSLHHSLGIPIGLIHNAWGGSAAECWVSKDALKNQETLAYLLNDHSGNDELSIAQHHADVQAYRDLNAGVLIEDSSALGINEEWFAHAFDTQLWHSCPRPAVKHKEQLEGDGVVWYRSDIALPAQFQNQICTLQLGRLDCQRQIWVNQDKIEHCHRDTPFFWLKPITHQIQCHETCSITIRACFQFCAGNAYGSAKNLVLINAAGESLALDQWFYRTECSYPSIDESRLQGNPPWPKLPVSWGLSQPVTMFNGLIAPLIPYAMDGVIWYQGESNVDRAEEYKQLLQVLIEDWRQRWALPLPFGIVQLAAYTPCVEQPCEQATAQLRLAQDWVCDHTPNCGLITAIDKGDANDIHPIYKQAIGERLAQWALHEVFKRPLKWQSPRIKSCKRIGSDVYINFTPVLDQLYSIDNAAIRGFAITDEHNNLHWVEAEIDGDDTIILDLAAFPNARKLHYAMSNNPNVNLFDERGLPALPFSISL